MTDTTCLLLVSVVKLFVDRVPLLLPHAAGDCKFSAGAARRRNEFSSMEERTYGMWDLLSNTRLIRLNFELTRADHALVVCPRPSITEMRRCVVVAITRDTISIGTTTRNLFSLPIMPRCCYHRRCCWPWHDNDSWRSLTLRSREDNENVWIMINRRARGSCLSSVAR